jgi:hypothetical protein
MYHDKDINYYNLGAVVIIIKFYFRLVIINWNLAEVSH